MDITHDPITAALVRALPAGKVLVRKQQLFTVSGVWMRPVAMVGDTLLISGIGGGASGNSSSDPSGGNSGQAAQRLPINIGIATSITVTVAVGAAGVNGSGVNSAGLAGGVSSFGALISLHGGTANTPNGSVSAAGRGAAGSYDPGVFGIYATQGWLGAFAAPSRAPQDFRSRSAGASGLIFDASDVGGVTINPSHQGGMGYGAGGASSGDNSATSGAGAPGAIYVEWDEVISL